jgi:hypothetical protein
MEKKLDMTVAWNDAVALLRANLETVLPILGIFILLPTVLMGYAVPQPEIVQGQSGDAAWAQLSAMISDYAPWILLSMVMGIIGNLAIYALVLNPTRPTVGQALTIALMFFIPMFLAVLISGLVIGIGMFLLLVPGVYLWVKFSLIGPAIVSENIKNPISALSRSWALTKGNSLNIFAFLLILIVVGVIIMIVVDMIMTGIVTMVLPDSAALLISAIFSGFTQTAFSAVMAFVMIAIYRQMSA